MSNEDPNVTDEEMTEIAKLVVEFYEKVSAIKPNMNQLEMLGIYSSIAPSIALLHFGGDINKSAEFVRLVSSTLSRVGEKELIAIRVAMIQNQADAASKRIWGSVIPSRKGEP